MVNETLLNMNSTGLGRPWTWDRAVRCLLATVGSLEEDLKQFKQTHQELMALASGIDPFTTKSELTVTRRCKEGYHG
jgi:hypothetical protein